MTRLDATRGRALPLTVVVYLCAAIFALLSLVADLSIAATRSWDGGGGTDTAFTTDANWSSNLEPGINDIAKFDVTTGDDDIYTVTFPFLPFGADISTDRLIVGNSQVTFEPDHSSTDYIAGSLVTAETGRGVIIGEVFNDTEVGGLVSHLGLLSTAAATLGHGSGSKGNLWLQQNNDRFDVTGNSAGDAELIVGRFGTANLIVSGGADVNVTNTLGNVIIGEYTGSSGSAFIEGAGSTWSVATTLVIGASGTGALYITADGDVISTIGVLGESGTGVGSVNVTGSGSTWTNSASIYVGGSPAGDGGAGTISIADQGFVDIGSMLKLWPGGSVSLNGGTLEMATLQLSGGTFNWTAGTLRFSSDVAVDPLGPLAVSAGKILEAVNALRVGNTGTGTLNVSGGGDVTSTTGILGATSTGNGSMTVTNAGSTWSNSGSVYIGGSASSDGGAGTLSITNQGFVDIGGTLKLWPGGNIELGGGTLETSTVQLAGGTFNLTSGTLRLQSLQLTSGSFNWTAGTVHFVSDIFVDPSGPFGNSVAIASGQVLETETNLYVGNAGVGTLNVSNNGIVTVSNSLTIASTGIVNLMGGTLKADSLIGGANLNWTGGTLHLATQNFIVDSGGTLGGNSVTIGPTQELWASLLNGDHAIGESGVGAMSVNGGTALFQNYAPPSVYTGSLSVGKLNGSVGELEIVGGGDVYTGTGYIGYAGGSTGNVVVNGLGSTFRTNNGLTVGRAGHGILEVTGGAWVNSGFGVIGESGGSTGVVTIDGAGSRWTNASAFFVYGYLTVGSNGTLNITDGAYVRSRSMVINGKVVVDGNDSTLDVRPDNFSNSVFLVGGGAGSSATLEITNGGRALVQKGEIGYYPGSTDSVVVDGAGSTWSILNDLTVGTSGAATLEITAGGQVNSQNGYVGRMSGGASAVTIDGFDSTWTNTVNLYVGDGGVGSLTVTNEGSAEATTVIVGTQGVIRGDGEVFGVVQNNGLVSPGASPGALTINGDYTQSAAGELLIELASATSFDQLLVTGNANATLGGTLTVIVINGFTPSIGQSFTILTADDVDGEFDTEPFPTASNFGFDVIYNAQSVVLKVIPALPGDYNANGIVDPADYVVWRKGLGTIFTPADYDEWRTHFGQTAGSGSGAIANAAVPEPTTLVVILVGTLALLSRRRDTVS